MSDLTLAQTLAMVHALATGAMVGLIWFVQIVHYPLMASVGRAEFTAYAQAHQRLTTFVVAPLMLTEAISAAALLLFPGPLSIALLAFNLALLLVIWGSTFLLQVPRHARLAQAFDEQAHRHLVRSNWIRTIAWSVRGVLAIFFIHAAAA